MSPSSTAPSQATYVYYLMLHTDQATAGYDLEDLTKASSRFLAATKHQCSYNATGVDLSNVSAHPTSPHFLATVQSNCLPKSEERLRQILRSAFAPQWHLPATLLYQDNTCIIQRGWQIQVVSSNVDLAQQIIDAIPAIVSCLSQWGESNFNRSISAPYPNGCVFGKGFWFYPAYRLKLDNLANIKNRIETSQIFPKNLKGLVKYPNSLNGQLVLSVSVTLKTA